MIKINGNNSLQELFFNTNNSFDSDELRNELIKKADFKKDFNISFYISIRQDGINTILQIDKEKSSYKLKLVDNKFIDDNCPKKILNIVNQPKILDFFTHKKAMLQDFFLSQKDHIDINEMSLEYRMFKDNNKFAFLKDIRIISNNMRSYNSNETSKNMLSFGILEKIYNVTFLYLSEKELKYVLNNFKTIDETDILFNTDLEHSKNGEIFRSTSLNEVKDKILKIVDNNNDRNALIQRIQNDKNS